MSQVRERPGREANAPSVEIDNVGNRRRADSDLASPDCKGGGDSARQLALESERNSRIPLLYSVNAFPPVLDAVFFGFAMYLGFAIALIFPTTSVATRFARLSLGFSNPLSFFPPRTPASPLKTRPSVIAAAARFSRESSSSSTDAAPTSEMGVRKSSSSVIVVGRERSTASSGSSKEGGWDEARFRLKDRVERWYLD